MGYFPGEDVVYQWERAVVADFFDEHRYDLLIINDEGEVRDRFAAEPHHIYDLSVDNFGRPCWSEFWTARRCRKLEQLK